jgi:hypothetical protein
MQKKSFFSTTPLKSLPTFYPQEVSEAYEVLSDTEKRAQVTALYWETA